MGRSLGRFRISGVLIAVCIGTSSICIQKILDLGRQVFVIMGIGGRDYPRHRHMLRLAPRPGGWGIGVLNFRFSVVDRVFNALDLPGTDVARLGPRL